MKKIFLLLGIVTNLLFAEYEDKTINGIVQNASKEDVNKMVLIIRNNDKEIIRAEINNMRIEKNDKVYGRCSKYEASRWKNCSIYTDRKYEIKKNDNLDINGKIKYVSLLSDYDVLEVENNNDVLQTVNIRVDKNKYYKKNESIYGYCMKAIGDEYTDCVLIKKLY